MARVLLVDDEPDILHTMARYLERRLNDIEILTANDAKEALSKVGDADLLVTDLRMPGMDGLELVHRVREEWPGLPCIMATAYPDLDIALKALNEEHVIAFLVKPFEPEALARATADALDARRRDHLRAEALKTAQDLVHDLREVQA